MISNLSFQSLLEYLQVSEDFIADTEKLKEYSKVIGNYFYQLYEITGDELLFRTSQNVLNCNDYWFFDHYRNFQIMDVTHINLCHNRLCPNCAKMRQATLLYKFSPLIEEISETCDLFHLSVSIPNVSAEEFEDSVDNILEAFSRLMKFFFGKQKIKGVNFLNFGWRAAARSFETTYSLRRWKKAKEYHPHIHCILALDKADTQKYSDSLTIKKHINKYSYENIDGKYILKDKFTDFEVFIQKLWRLVYDGVADKNKRLREFNRKQHRLKKYFEDKFRTDEKFRELFPRESVESGFVTKNEAIAGTKPKKIKAAYITKADIDTLPLGYSCKCSQVDPAGYYEVFKYVCKVTDEDNRIMSFNQFRTLYYALKGKKTFQAYGKWFNVKVDTIDDTMNALYNDIKRFWNEHDKPESISLKIEDVHEVAKERIVRIVSRRNIKPYLESLGDYASDPDIQRLTDAYRAEKQLEAELVREFAYSHKKVVSDNKKVKERLRREKEYKANMLSLEREYEKRYAKQSNEESTTEIQKSEILQQLNIEDIGI